jgi:hypothetical protein
MNALHIPWSPRLLLAGRTFRLPVQALESPLDLGGAPFKEIDRRYSLRDGAYYLYLRAPTQSGDYTIEVQQNGRHTSATIQVRTLDQLRYTSQHDNTSWPRRWPLSKAWQSSKMRQTLLDMPVPAPDLNTVAFWRSLDDDELWRQLPPAEMPRAHFANVHQGCPQCGTAIFTYGGFYPWLRSHAPIDYRSTCPSCKTMFPSNDLKNGDYTSGDFADDGYGYFNKDGHLFLFAATYARDQVRFFGASIGHLTAALRIESDVTTARTLALMLLRYAVDIIYLSSAPQFRYGPSEGLEKAWPWGQTDWSGSELGAKGMMRYSIDVPYISETLALAYDTVWPFLKDDDDLVERAQKQGIQAQSPADLLALIEEMLAGQIQCCLDGGARSNLPRVSQAVLVLLRGLDRGDGQDALTWLYDKGPDRLRTFGINNFFPDGTPPEATGGYNSIHSNGLFDLEYHLRHLRALYPTSYPEAEFPSLTTDPRAARVARAPVEITTMGHSWFQFGDGSAPGSAAQLGKAMDEEKKLTQPMLHAPLATNTLAHAAEYTGDVTVKAMHNAISKGQHPTLDSATIHDGVGIAILRTDETPERAAAGICYGDTTGHRHMDLLDTQLFAHGYVFLGDLGYPQSWASIDPWEAHWATHNSGWGVVEGVHAGRVMGRGRLLHYLQAPGIQVLDIEAERWAWDEIEKRWYRPGVSFRRLLALVETDDKGVAMIDLMRITGGQEHWRMCRGCGPVFLTDLSQQARTGTLAGEQIERGNIKDLPHPDYAALAYMDEVALNAPAYWQGTWSLDAQRAAQFDVRQLAVSDDVQLRSARATAIMGTPEESNYNFRTLAWHRKSQGVESTCIDLLFEPRIGESRLVEAHAIDAPSNATGVELKTKGGQHLRLYWSPDAETESKTHFADGTDLQGPLALAIDKEITACASASIHIDEQKHHFANAVQRGIITTTDEQACTIEVGGLAEVREGDRLYTEGRGRSYRVEEVTKLNGEHHSLRLDVTTLLGRGRVLSAGTTEIELDFHILARTGYLNDARLRQANGTTARIESAYNPNAERTHVRLCEDLPKIEIG